MNLLNIGQKYNNFKLKVLKKLPEIHMVYREIQHTKTGATVIHLDADDRENFFSLCFSTHPSSSNGVAHILEHTVLCGSKKYPVKDPFFSMSRRSSNTFMNAMTGSDFTCYPASSCIEKDFFNLLDVYVDAVFHPLLTELSFLQEGHRLEWKNSKELEIKGIVFNEMKGAMNSGQSRLWQGIYQGLFPQLTYRHNSGGDPKSILNLSYPQLLQFHKKFYHPSRCLFFFYGNIPLEKTLTYLGKQLDDQKALPPLKPLPPQKRFLTPKKRVDFFPSTDQSSSQNLFALSFLTCPIKKQEELLFLQLLSIAFMGHDAAPLKKKLLDSGLCIEVFVSLDDEVSEVPISFIFKGVEKKQIKKLEEVFFTSLKDLHKEKNLLQVLKLALHQMEFSKLEIQKGSIPYGLSLFYKTALMRQHGIQAQDTLSLQSLFKSLRDKLNNPQKAQAKVRHFLKKYFLSNTHRLSLLMLPEPKLQEKEEKILQEWVEKKQKALTPKQKKKIKEDAKSLHLLQEKEEDLEILPKIALKDLSKTPLHYPLKKSLSSVYKREVFTNGITYGRLYLAYPSFSLKKAPWVQLYTSLLPELGWNQRPYAKQLHYLQSHLGNLYTSSSILYLDDSGQNFVPSLSISSKALKRKRRYLLELFHDFFSYVDFQDQQRVKELIKQTYTHVISNLNRQAMSYAKKAAMSSCSQSHQLIHALSGLPYVNFLKELHENLDTQLKPLTDFFLSFHAELCAKWKGAALFTDEEKHLKQLPLSTFKPQALKEKDCHPKRSLSPSLYQGYLIASPVAFTCYAFKTISMQHPDSLYLSIASELMDNLVLHKRIREQGGAYGGGSQYDLSTGCFSFYGYRDPHLLLTLKAFEEAIDCICKEAFSERELEEAKLGIFQSLDTPLSPGSEGAASFLQMLRKNTLSKRKERRKILFTASKKDIAKACKKHLKKSFQKGSLVSFANEGFFKKQNQAFKKAKLPALNTICL